ncbi:hypothetical protein AVEN_210051-1 [Araneus ventricosus]|uniref:Uncharacterized protein n=1 Tax=Araneus ventricosus TaxID=182803 RepID=A0A4Y2JQ01_ARAVE|nr:hypothetical protein AVEN_210051-1 [Araneus ventricosus]
MVSSTHSLRAIYDIKQSTQAHRHADAKRHRITHDRHPSLSSIRDHTFQKHPLPGDRPVQSKYVSSHHSCGAHDARNTVYSAHSGMRMISGIVVTLNRHPSFSPIRDLHFKNTSQGTGLCMKSNARIIRSMWHMT